MYHPGSCEGESGCLLDGNKVKFCSNPMNRKSQMPFVLFLDGN